MTSPWPHTYRATLGAWIGEFGLPVIFFTLLGYIAVSRAGLHPALLIPAVLVIAVVGTKETVLPMLRSWILFDRSIISGSVNGRRFHLFDAEILAAWLVEHKRQRVLCLGTKSSTILFPLQFLDDRAVWEEITRRLPPEALGEQAVQRLPVYRDLFEERGRTLITPTTQVVTDRWMFQIFGWGGLTFSLFSLVASFQNQVIETGLLFGILSLGCAAALVRWGMLEINPRYIIRSTMLTRYSITWAEVVRIEKDPLGLSLVLVGTGCQMALPGPTLWSPVGKKPALELIETQARLRGIPVRSSFLALLKISRRTRIKR